MSPSSPIPGAAAKHDLRMPVVGLFSWVAALVTLVWRWSWVVIALLVLALALRALISRGESRDLALPKATTCLVWSLVVVSAAGSAWIRAQQQSGSLTAELAQQKAVTTAEVVITSEPKMRTGAYGDYVVVKATTRSVQGRGELARERVRVLILGDASWGSVALGSVVRLVGKSRSTDALGLAATLRTRGPAQIRRQPRWWHQGGNGVRAAIREAATRPGLEASALVPAIVDGDEAGLSSRIVENFRDAGLTHLTAVSGANLTLACGFMVWLARWGGVRGRWLWLVAGLGTIGFVLLAQAEASVLRAAAMGSVALIGLGTNGRERGTRAWGFAVTALVLWDPWLSVNFGFALSALATAAILWLAPSWRGALETWMPRPIAEAVAVPAAAQLACTPIVAALSGKVSLVAVVANLLAAPVVAPATVIGLFAGLAALASSPFGHLLAWPGVWLCQWLVWVAERGASLPGATLSWGGGAWSLSVLTALCALAVLVVPSIMRWRWASVGCAALMVGILLVPSSPRDLLLPRIGGSSWPPPGWLMVACDVTQGDGLVINVGAGRGIVVDVGPDSQLIDGCLTRLGIDEVPLVVLSHFHADHVAGLEGVLRGRRVGAIEVTTLDEPSEQAESTRQAAEDAGIPIRRVNPGEVSTVGKVSWVAVAPVGKPPAGSESPPNDASIVLLVDVAGVRILTTGDQEPVSQSQLRGADWAASVDILKVAHHGSVKQDHVLLHQIGAQIAVISSGQPNSYGHPSPDTVAELERAGMKVLRTDELGDIAITGTPGALSYAGRGSPRENRSVFSH